MTAHNMPCNFLVFIPGNTPSWLGWIQTHILLAFHIRAEPYPVVLAIDYGCPAHNLLETSVRDGALS